MDLNILFENIGSIATSLERIADSLEQRGAKENTVSISATTATVEDKPKRTRRTKAEIEAEAQAAAAPAAEIPDPQFAAPVVAAPVVAAPVVAAPVVAAPVVAAPVVAAPVVAAPVVAAPAVAAPVVAAPVVAQPTNEALPAGVDPAYTTYTVEHQFTVLNQLLAPYFATYGQVRDAVFGEAAKHGLGAPFSDQADRALPGANYRAVSNEARFAIYVAGAKAIAGLASL